MSYGLIGLAAERHPRSELLELLPRDSPGFRAFEHQLGRVGGGSTSAAMRSRGRTEKPPGAWTPDQVITMLIDAMNAGDFYVLCPDNEVTREVDARRIQWAAGDITENRPALSRWHPDYKTAFEQFLHAEK